MNNIEKYIEGFIPFSKDDSIISIVKTPVSDYIVIDRKHPTFDGQKTHLNFLYELNHCIFCIPIKPICEDDLVNNITKVIMEQPNQQIIEDWDDRLGTKIPSGTIKDLLSESSLDQIAKNNHPEDPKYKSWLYSCVPEIIFNQLIRNSSPNHLKITDERYPSFVEFSDNWIMLVNQGHGANNGYAPTDAFLYRIIDKEKIQQQNFFSYYNVHVQKPEKVKFKFLSRYETRLIMTDSNKVNKDILTIKIRINDEPAIIYK